MRRPSGATLYRRFLAAVVPRRFTKWSIWMATGRKIGLYGCAWELDAGGWAQRATKAGDKRLRANKPALPVCSETQKKAERDRELWAEKVFARAAETMIAHESRLQKQSH